MDDDGSLDPPKVIVTPKEMLEYGLKQVHYTEARMGRASRETNTGRFKSAFGCNQVVAAQIFEDLQVTANQEARLDENKISMFYFLQALNFLYRYDVEKEREPKFDRSPKTMREWVWYYVKKIAALKHEKIVFPEAEELGDDIWIMTVDCTDCPIEEIEHPVLSQDPALFSFKINGAGLRYEFGIDLFYSNLIWCNDGPFFPGKVNDNTIFAENGLKKKLASLGKKALADKIYNGHPNECSTFNAVDSEVVSTFKARAQMRHEQFNGMVKGFKCMCVPFQNKPEKVQKHKNCLEAVVVICQYRMEHDEPLFDLLAGL